MGPDAIQFQLNGQPQAVRDLPATTTLLQYLREHAALCGSKEGCAEGDCGACTVLLSDGPRWRAVNSCIRLLPTVDGRSVLTVEGLSPPAGPLHPVQQATLHPVQQAMIDQHASQCGFCTPGFVMSLTELYLRQPAASREQVVEQLSGNLCRCTGYRPIIDAGLAMHGYPAPTPALPGPNPGPARRSSLRLPGYHAPLSLDELAHTLLQRPDALLLAGGTDIGLWVTKQLRQLPDIVYLGDVAELNAVHDDGQALDIGAAVSLTDAWAVLVAAHPALAELAQRFASPPVRNAGTLCGNVANGSPIGDSMPALIALGASVRLRCGDATRQLPMEALYLGYQKKDLAPGEFVHSVTVPHAPDGLRFAAYKLSKRIDQDIAAVCIAVSVQLQGDTVSDARIACGGLAATPRRATAAEAALRGQPWSEASLAAAVAALARDFQPLSDLRASSRYRLTAAGNLLRRFYLAHPAAGTVPRLRSFEALDR